MADTGLVTPWGVTDVVGGLAEFGEVDRIDGGVTQRAAVGGRSSPRLYPPSWQACRHEASFDISLTAAFVALLERRRCDLAAVIASYHRAGRP
jgi:hypothetical protein